MQNNPADDDEPGDFFDPRNLNPDFEFTTEISPTNPGRINPDFSEPQNQGIFPGAFNPSDFDLDGSETRRIVNTSGNAAVGSAPPFPNQLGQTQEPRENQNRRVLRSASRVTLPSDPRTILPSGPRTSSTNVPADSPESPQNVKKKPRWGVTLRDYPMVGTHRITQAEIDRHPFFDDGPKRKGETRDKWRSRLTHAREAMGVLRKDPRPEPKKQPNQSYENFWVSRDMLNGQTVQAEEVHRRRLNTAHENYDAQYAENWRRAKADRHARNIPLRAAGLAARRAYDEQNDRPRVPTPEPPEDSGDELYDDEFYLADLNDNTRRTDRKELRQQRRAELEKWIKKGHYDQKPQSNRCLSCQKVRQSCDIAQRGCRPCTRCEDVDRICVDGVPTKEIPGVFDPNPRPRGPPKTAEEARQAATARKRLSRLRLRDKKNNTAQGLGFNDMTAAAGSGSGRAHNAAEESMFLQHEAIARNTPGMRRSASPERDRPRNYRDRSDPPGGDRSFTRCGQCRISGSRCSRSRPCVDCRLQGIEMLCDSEIHDNYYGGAGDNFGDDGFFGIGEQDEGADDDPLVPGDNFVDDAFFGMGEEERGADNEPFFPGNIFPGRFRDDGVFGVSEGDRGAREEDRVARDEPFFSGLAGFDDGNAQAATNAASIISLSRRDYGTDGMGDVEMGGMEMEEDGYNVADRLQDLVEVGLLGPSGHNPQEDIWAGDFPELHEYNFPDRSRVPRAPSGLTPFASVARGQISSLNLRNPEDRLEPHSAQRNINADPRFNPQASPGDSSNPMLGLLSTLDFPAGVDTANTPLPRTVQFPGEENGQVDLPNLPSTLPHYRPTRTQSGGISGFEEKPCDEKVGYFSDFDATVLCRNTPAKACDNLSHDRVYCICHDCRSIQDNHYKRNGFTDQMNAGLKAYTCLDCAGKVRGSSNAFQDSCLCSSTVNKSWLCHEHRFHGIFELTRVTGIVEEHMIRTAGNKTWCVACRANEGKVNSGAWGCKVCREWVFEPLSGM